MSQIELHFVATHRDRSEYRERMTSVLSLARQICDTPGALLHTSRTSRVHAALTALAFMLASLAGVAHEASTTHVRCAEHGELIHADGPAGSVAASRDSVATERDSTKPHGDDHCVIASGVRQSRIVPHAPIVVPVVAAIDGLVVAAPHTARAPSSSLYRTAPKTSPPV
jgi:hypothetical protein